MEESGRADPGAWTPVQRSVHGPPPLGPLLCHGEGWLTLPGLRTRMWRWGQTGSHDYICGAPHPIRAPLRQEALGKDAGRHMGPGRALACSGWGRSLRGTRGGLPSTPPALKVLHCPCATEPWTSTAVVRSQAGSWLGYSEAPDNRSRGRRASDSVSA